MPLFNRSKNLGDVCLILDIGNASVAGSLVLYETGKAPQALYTIRIPLSVGDKPHPDKLQFVLETEIKQILTLISKKGFEHPYFKTQPKTIEKILCVYASPWYVSKTKKVSIVNEKPFFITKVFLEDVLTKEVKIFEEELLSGIHGQEFVSDVVVMEKSVIDAKINGYSIPNPIGQKTNMCDVSIYLGIGSEKVTHLVEDVVLQVFPHHKEKIVSHTFPLVAQTALQTIFPHEQNYLLIDVTGEVTDVTCVREGLIQNTVSFPSGKFFIVRKLMQTLDVPAEVAQSFLHLYQINDAHPEIEEKIQQALVDVEREWSIYLEDALTHFGSVSELPSKVYLTADSDIAKIFEDFLKISKTDTTALWRKNSMVVHISEEVLTHFYTSANHLMFDECAALDAIFLSVFQ